MSLVFERVEGGVEEVLCRAAGGSGTRCAEGMDGCSWRGWFGEQVEDVAEILLELADLLGVDGRAGVEHSEGQLGFPVAHLGLDGGTCSGDGVALVVEEGFDAERCFDVASAVEALASAAFVGLELRELTLPETEDVGRDVAELRDVADAKVELVRDV